MKKQRVLEIELLRGIAFLLVLIQHSVAAYLYIPTIDNASSVIGFFLLSLLRIAVPLFVFITGFVLVYNYEKLHYGSFLKKRTKDVFLPYVIWSSLFFLWDRYLNNVRTSPAEYASEFVHFIPYGTAMYHLWFMVMIIQFYLFFPLLKRIVERIGKSGKWLFHLVILGLIHVTLLYWYPSLTANVFAPSVPESLTTLMEHKDNSLIFWCYYFVLGGVCALRFDQIKQFLLTQKKRLAAIWLLSYGYIVFFVAKHSYIEESGKFTIYHGLTDPLNMHMFYFLVVSILLIFAGSFLITQHLKSVTQVLQQFSLYSFPAYLFHVMPLYYCITYLDPWFLFEHNWKNMLMNAFLVICFSYIFAVVLGKTKQGMVHLGCRAKRACRSSNR